jgi:hypothetical protein
MTIINNLILSLIAKSGFSFVPAARHFFASQLTLTTPWLSYFEKALPGGKALRAGIWIYAERIALITQTDDNGLDILRNKPWIMIRQVMSRHASH